MKSPVAAPDIFFCRCYGGARRFSEGASLCVTWFSTTTTTPHHIVYHLFTCLLSEASLGSMKSAKQIDCIFIIRLLPTDAHIAAVRPVGVYFWIMTSGQYIIPNVSYSLVYRLT